VGPRKRRYASCSRNIQPTRTDLSTISPYTYSKNTTQSAHQGSSTHNGPSQLSVHPFIVDLADFQSPYSNGLHVLVRFTPRRPNSDLTIIASRDRGIFQRDFTLQAFAPSSTQLNLERVKASLPFSYTINGHLNSRNAGGHPGNPSHMINPQYKVVIRPDTGKVRGVVRMVVQGDREIPWNIKLVWGNGTRVTE
jgi:hypothetical protein